MTGSASGSAPGALSAAVAALTWAHPLSSLPMPSASCCFACSSPVAWAMPSMQTARSRDRVVQARQDGAVIVLGEFPGEGVGGVGVAAEFPGGVRGHPRELAGRVARS